MVSPSISQGQSLCKMGLALARRAMIGVQPGSGRAWGRLGRAALLLGQEEEVGIFFPLSNLTPQIGEENCGKTF